METKTNHQARLPKSKHPYVIFKHKGKLYVKDSGDDETVALCSEVIAEAKNKMDSDHDAKKESLETEDKGHKKDKKDDKNKDRKNEKEPDDDKKKKKRLRSEEGHPPVGKRAHGKTDPAKVKPDSPRTTRSSLLKGMRLQGQGPVWNNGPWFNF